MRRVFLAIGLFIVIVIVANYNFFWQNIRYSIWPEKYIVKPQSESGRSFESDALYIEKLGIAAPVQYVEENSENVFQAALQKGVVHYPGTALPGEFGNVYIFGHSSDDAWRKGDYKTIFALLPRIEKGAKVILTDKEGQSFVYKVIDNFVAGTKETKWLDQGEYEKKLLTLQTSYPIGTSLMRYIVIAELLE